MLLAPSRGHPRDGLPLGGGGDGAGTGRPALRASAGRLRKTEPPGTFEYFTARLRTFGDHVCRQMQEIEWLTLLEEVQIVPFTRTESPRKAA